MFGLVKKIRFVIEHPLNKRQKMRALRRWVSWHLISGLIPGPAIFKFVDNSVLMIARGMNGATGNYYAGLHEFEDMSFVLHMLSDSDLFVDIGANIGSYTILAGAVCGARCISIEPIPKTYSYLLRNINLNDIRSRVDARNIGLGREAGVLNFSDSLDTVNHVVEAGEDVHAIQVQVQTIDEVVGDQDPVLIKIDVEGFETEVLAGANNVLDKKSLLAVIMELNGSGSRYGYDEDALHRNMMSHGFMPYRYEPFDRELISLNGKNLSTGNTLYLRNVELVKKRLSDAASFTVNGQRV